MRRLLMTKIFYGSMIVLGLFTSPSFANIVNPCQYVNVIQEQQNHLDTGNDENFERIKQQNNREMVIACQEYEIKQLHERTNDWNRDNY